jgi:hypothetical protein
MLGRRICTKIGNRSFRAFGSPKHDSHHKEASDHKDSHDNHHHDGHHDHHGHEMGETMTKEEAHGTLNRFWQYLFTVTDPVMRHEHPHKPSSITYQLEHLKPARGRKLINYFIKECNAIDVERPITNVYNPPKIHENSVFLYQSEDFGNRMRQAKFLELPTIATMLCAMPSVGYFALYWATLYAVILRSQHYELANRLVLRMDLLPHLEMVSFQKVGFMGRITTRLVRVQDLEKVEVDWDKENAFWIYNTQLDRDMMFRNKATGELFVFDNTGIWNWEGISHKLLY